LTETRIFGTEKVVGLVVWVKDGDALDVVEVCGVVGAVAGGCGY